MSSNKSAKNKLIELYGEECFIENPDKDLNLNLSKHSLTVIIAEE